MAKIEYKTAIQLNIRLLGTLEDVDRGISHLHILGRVTRISKPYSNAGDDMVRVYVDIELPVEVRGAERK